MQKWEYKIIGYGHRHVESLRKDAYAWYDLDKQVSEYGVDKRLNELGQDGWELMNVEPNYNHTAATFYLKRPIE